jgi:hypothetical protein
MMIDLLNLLCKPFPHSEMAQRKILGKALCEAVEPTFYSKETRSGLSYCQNKSCSKKAIKLTARFIEPPSEQRIHRKNCHYSKLSLKQKRFTLRH